MQERTCKHRNDLRQFLVKMVHWTIVSIMLLQQMKTTDAAKFKGDSCVSKNKPGVCKGWGECPVIKTLIDGGEYTSREVVSCGFDIKEELICCPVIKTESRIETTTDENSNRFQPTSTQETPVKDFWLDLLQNTTSTTTAAPDFWLDLLKPTVVTTTTTTTIRPLMVGDQKLNENSGFFDFNALLGGNQNGGSQRNGLTNPADRGSSSNSNSNLGFVAVNPEGRSNINQWNFAPSGANLNRQPNLRHFNNGRGNGKPNSFSADNNGNFGWGQANLGRGQNMGRGPSNNNGNGHFNGRGPHNNGRGRTNMGLANQNSGFVSFPSNNMRPNNYFDGDITPNRTPDLPLNNIQEPNSNHPNNNNNEKIDDLIQNVFGNTNSEHSSNNNQESASEANVFNVENHQNPSPQPAAWSRPIVNNNNDGIHFVGIHTPHEQMELINPEPLGHFEIIPVPGSQIVGHDLSQVPSTSFIQQPAIIENWPVTPVHAIHTSHTSEFQPAQAVYGNLVMAGLDIVKVQDGQEQFRSQPTKFVMMQPEYPNQQFLQQPEVIYQQQPQAPQNFGQLISQQLIEQPPHTVSAGKEGRSIPPQQQFVQSPSSKTLDPLQSLDFRPTSADRNTFLGDSNSLSTTPIKPEHPQGEADRPAVRACRRITAGLNVSITNHILGGIPAELGEFPHMAALGYSRIGGDDKPPYDIRCGGTLIDKRFVLTAAHCVSERENVPSIVRLGVVNFTDPIEMKAAVEVKIKQTYIHDDYLNRLTYNDIAILELERNVEYSENVYPVCLYVNEKDPDPKIKLWVTGWGTINTTTRSFSDILLKAPLHTSSLENCNRSFTDYGLNRRIPEGIIRTQLCAEDKDQIKDACQGDSGGPLNLIVDESSKDYRLVGVVSSGFGCASSTPGLYTRVAAFLDFIEKIVWPNGAD